MTTNTKLDLRTAPIEQVCEWCAVNVMGLTKGKHRGYWFALDKDGCPENCYHDNPVSLSLDAVAAVERAAREKWDLPTVEIQIYRDGSVSVRLVMCQFCSMAGNSLADLPAIWLRAVALAVEAATQNKKE